MKKSKKNGRGTQKSSKRQLMLRLVFPLLTLICLAGFIGSLIFPNEVLDTYIINMSEEEGDLSVLLPLSYDDPITYNINTGSRSIKGVQLGIHKRGESQEGQILCYNVYVGGSVVSENEYDISKGDELQYVYLPFKNYEACRGKLSITLILKDGTERLSENNVAALTANHRQVTDSRTIVPDDQNFVLEYDGPESGDEYQRAFDMEEELGYSLKGSHIYTHDTYPFLYDFRVLTFVFLAVSMTFCYRERRQA